MRIGIEGSSRKPSASSAAEPGAPPGGALEFSYPPPHRDFQFAFLAILAGVLARILLMLLGTGTLIDDAYITLRYGRNLFEGHGLVYNQGEHVLGTQPLYALWAGLLWKVSDLLFGGRGVEYLITLANIGFFALAAALFARWMKVRSLLLVHVPLVVLCCYVPFLDNTTTGMETSLFLLLITFSLDALHRRKLLLTSVLLGLAALTRPEGNLWALAVVLNEVLHRRLGWRLLLPYTAMVASWGAFAALYYGTPVPLSARAKSGWFNGIYANEGFLRQLWDVLASFTLGPWPDWHHWRTPAAAAALLILVLCFLFARGLAALRKERDPKIIWPVFFVLCVTFYVAGRGATWPSWYAIPPGLGFVVGVVHGIEALSGARLARFRLSPGRLRFVLVVLSFVFLVTSVLIWNRVRLPYYLNVRESHERTGRTLARAADPDDTLFVVEIGCIGYFADRYVYDMGGLVSPEIQALRRRSWDLGEAPNLVKRFWPDWIVVNDIHLLKLLHSEPEGWFEDRYALEFRTYLYFTYRKRS